MYKRILAVLCCLLMLSGCALAEDRTARVFMAGETPLFTEDAELLTLHVCPLTGADAMLLTYGEHNMLVDTGKRIDFDKLQDMLLRAGLDHVDMIFNTHPHSDHIGGVIPLVESGFQVGQFMTVFPPRKIQRRFSAKMLTSTFLLLRVKDLLLTEQCLR